jgi:hypothetical protein
MKNKGRAGMNKGQKQADLMVKKQKGRNLAPDGWKKFFKWAKLKA